MRPCASTKRRPGSECSRAVRASVQRDDVRVLMVGGDGGSGHRGRRSATADDPASPRRIAGTNGVEEKELEERWEASANPALGERVRCPRRARTLHRDGTTPVSTRGWRRRPAPRPPDHRGELHRLVEDDFDLEVSTSRRGCLRDRLPRRCRPPRPLAAGSSSSARASVPSADGPAIPRVRRGTTRAEARRRMTTAR